VSGLLDDELVSVIIPTYNSEKFINETLDSALSQTYHSMEIIIVDDCSSDSTQNIVDPYLRKYSNLKYERLINNSGAAVARNRGLELAIGRFIAFLDSDDVWYPNKLEMQLELMTQDNLPICFTAIEMIDENGRLIKGKRHVKGKVDYKFLLKNTMIATSTVVIDRKITGEFRMPLRRSGQDYATWLYLTRNGHVAHGIDLPLVKYRKGKNTLSSKKIQNIKKVYQIQTMNEGIDTFNAIYNSLWYAFNAFKKYFL
jgi:teichuronic acid biosynthesis glycosyltransferase TuaG